MIEYPYAKTVNGNIIHINDVTNNKDIFYCPHCNSIMEAVWGNQRVHYFRHAKGFVCNKETYIHSTGKEILLKKLIENEKFFIQYDKYSKKKFDLKLYYDYFYLEHPYHFNGLTLVPDILVDNNAKKYSPIFIEINNTHSCEEQN